MLRLVHSTQHAPGNYLTTGVYYCTGLVTPSVKIETWCLNDTVAIRDNTVYCFAEIN